MVNITSTDLTCSRLVVRESGKFIRVRAPNKDSFHFPSERKFLAFAFYCWDVDMMLIELKSFYCLINFLTSLNDFKQIFDTFEVHVVIEVIKKS